MKVFDGEGGGKMGGSREISLEKGGGGVLERRVCHSRHPLRIDPLKVTNTKANMTLSPSIILHGGPGGGCPPGYRQYFDPAKYRVVMIDQRGAGQSTPLGELKENTTWDLIEDVEKVRERESEHTTLSEHTLSEHT